MRLVVCLLLLVACGRISEAATVTSIANAVIAAADGDVITLSPGTYTGCTKTGTWSGAIGLTIDGAGATIDCSSGGTLDLFDFTHTDPAAVSVVKRLTIIAVSGRIVYASGGGELQISDVNLWRTGTNSLPGAFAYGDQTDLTLSRINSTAAKCSEALMYALNAGLRLYDSSFTATSSNANPSATIAMVNGYDHNFIVTNTGVYYHNGNGVHYSCPLRCNITMTNLIFIHDGVSYIGQSLISAPASLQPIIMTGIYCKGYRTAYTVIGASGACLLANSTFTDGAIGSSQYLVLGQGSPTITGVTFRNLVSVTTQFDVTTLNAEFALVNNLVMDNVWGRVLLYNTLGSSQYYNSTFRNNYVGWPVGAMVLAGNLVLQGCLFENNTMVGRMWETTNAVNNKVLDTVFKNNNYGAVTASGVCGTLCGLLSFTGSAVTISGVTFIGNYGYRDPVVTIVAGASSCKVINSVFTANTIGSLGGASASSLLLSMGSAVIVTNNTFTSNVGVKGTVTVDACTNVALNNCSFVNNSVSAQGGGLAVVHGGTGKFSYSTFRGNSAVNGGAVFIEDSTSTYMTSNTIVGNSGAQGGGVYISTSVTAVGDYLNISNNVAYTGAGVYSTSNLRLTFATINGNSASVDAGGLFLSADGAAMVVRSATISGNTGQNGAGVFVKAGTMNISNVVINDNRGQLGVGVQGTGTGKLVLSSATLRGNSASLGGAALFWQSTQTANVSTLVISDSFADSMAGGIGCGENAGLSISSVTFTNCQSGTRGGAIDIQSNSIVSLSNITISNGKSGSGGAIAFGEGVVVTASSIKITNNTATVAGGAISILDDSRVFLSNVNMTGNTAVGSGGAIYSSAAAINVTRGSLIADNRGGSGGAIYALGGVIGLDGGTVVRDNAALSGTGGGIYCSACLLVTAGVRLERNNASMSGGALYCDPAAAESTPRASVTNTVFLSNTAAQDGPLEAQCSVCGCCDYGSVVTITTARRCVLFPDYTCNYTCATGYNITVGTFGGVTCELGVTSSDICTPIACDPLTAPTNGAVNYNGARETPNTATFTCDTGYSPSFVSTRQCIGPVWTGATPECLPVPCGALSSQDHGALNSSDCDPLVGCAHEDRVTVTCDAGYGITSGSSVVLGGVVTMECNASRWVPNQPSCQRGACPDIVIPANGAIVNIDGHFTGDTVSFQCNNGYFMNGASAFSCIAPSWTAATPTCEGIACPVLTVPGNGTITISSQVTPGRATFQCNSGFAISGHTPLDCLGPKWQYRGVNNGGDVSCSPVFCPGFDLPFNTSDTCRSSMAIGTQCALSCVAGYQGPKYTVACAQSTDLTALDGIFIGAAGQAPCTICESGRFSEKGEKCTDCQYGFTRTPGAVSQTDCLCNEGFYEGVPMSGVCEQCPDGALCRGERAQPVAAAGYFFVNNAYLSCYPAGACQSDNICSEGYTGYVCGFCDHKFYRLNGKCEPCPVPGNWKVIVTAVFGGLATLLLIPLAKPSSASERSVGFGSVTILINFVQIVAIFIDLRLPWPNTIRSIQNAFSALNFNIQLISPECVAEVTFYEKYVIQLALPLIVLAFYAVFALVQIIATAICCVRDRKQLKNAAADIVWDAIGGYLFFLSLAYILLARAAFSILSCREQADGSHVLNLSQGDACYTDQWRQYIPLTGLAIALYVVGIPLLFLVAGFVARRKYGPSAAGTHQPTAFYIRKFEVHAWYWECTVMLRKVLITAIALFLVNSLIAAVILCSAVIFFSVIFTAALNPYQWDGHDFVDFCALLCTLAILFSGLVVNSPTFTAVSVADYVATALVVITFVVGVACFLYEIYLNVSLLWTIRFMRIAKQRLLPNSEHTAAITVCHGAVYRVDVNSMVPIDTTEEDHKGNTLVWPEGIRAAVTLGSCAAVITEEEMCVVQNGEKVLHFPLVAAALASDDRSILVTVTATGLLTLSRRVGVSSAGSTKKGALKDGSGAGPSGSASHEPSSDPPAKFAEKWSIKLPAGHYGPHCVALDGMSVFAVCQVMDAAGEMVPEFKVHQVDMEDGLLIDEWTLVADGKERPTALCLQSHMVVVGTSSGGLIILETSSPSKAHRVYAHARAVTCLHVWREWLFSGGEDGTVRVSHHETYVAVFTFRVGHYSPTALAFHDDVLYVGLENGAVVSFDISKADNVFIPLPKHVCPKCRARYCNRRKREHEAITYEAVASEDVRDVTLARLRGAHTEAVNREVMRSLLKSAAVHGNNDDDLLLPSQQSARSGSISLESEDASNSS